MTYDGLERRSWWRRHSRALPTIFVVGAIAFFGGAGYAVFTSDSERQDICAAVKKVRDDVVSALDILTESTRDVPEVVKAREVIRVPKCP